MALQPGVVLLVGVEIVKDDFEPPVRILSNHVVHEGEKLLAAPTLLVGSLDLTGRHLEGGKQRRGAVALVVVTVSRSPVRARAPGSKVSRQHRELPRFSAAPYRGRPHRPLWSRIADPCSRTNSCGHQGRFSVCAKSAIRTAHRRRRAPRRSMARSIVRNPWVA